MHLHISHVSYTQGNVYIFICCQSITEWRQILQKSQPINAQKSMCLMTPDRTPLQFGHCATAALKEFPDNLDNCVCIAPGGVVPHQPQAPYFPCSGSQTPGDVYRIPARTGSEAAIGRHMHTHTLLGWDEQWMQIHTHTQTNIHCMYTRTTNTHTHTHTHTTQHTHTHTRSVLDYAHTHLED